MFPVCGEKVAGFADAAEVGVRLFRTLSEIFQVSSEPLVESLPQKCSEKVECFTDQDCNLDSWITLLSPKSKQSQHRKQTMKMDGMFDVIDAVAANEGG